MAQSATTVTTPNPTPPTNFSCTGGTPPQVPNYTKLTYSNYVGVGLLTALGNPGAAPAPLGLWSAVANPPPFFDDAVGGIGNGQTFQAATAALASGTGATSGGTENTYPGTGSTAGTNFLGAVPASTSATAEGGGTETLFTQTYSGAIYAPVVLTTVGCGPTQTATTILQGPNASHASSLSPPFASNPTLTTIAPTTAVSGTGTTALTAVTGVGFNRQSVVYANGVPIPTVFTNSTTLTATMPKKATSGTWPITVVTGGAVVTAPQTFTWT